MANGHQIRAHAEAWYLALKTWDVYEGDRVTVGGVHRSGGGGMAVVGVGSFSQGRAAGGSAGISISTMYLRTPIGPVPAGQAAAAVTAQGDALARVRNDTSMQSLIHPNGRAWRSPIARQYALTVLDVAAALGDRQAREMHAVLSAPSGLQSGQVSPTLSVDSI